MHNKARGLVWGTMTRPMWPNLLPMNSSSPERWADSEVKGAEFGSRLPAILFSSAVVTD